MRLTEANIQPQLTRRRPGQSALTTPRDEKDRVQIQSGTEFGITLGTPIALLVKNEDQRPKDYGGNTMDKFPRPSHADYTYQQKYGIKASSGGGRSSARETLARVAAGTVAEVYLSQAHNIEIVAFVSSVGPEYLFNPAKTHNNPEYFDLLNSITREKVDTFLPVRCPDQEATHRMAEIIAHHQAQHDSIGGTITCVIRNMPIGLGEPCFDKLEAVLAHAMLSIPSTKGFEFGSGFSGCEIPGSVHNDSFIKSSTFSSGNKGKPSLSTKTNNSGGIQGGISNGENVYFRVAFKPPATIGQAQNTVTYDGEEDILEAKGRHDPCVVPRAVPIVEAMAALTIMDSLMSQEGRNAVREHLMNSVVQAKQVSNGGDMENGHGISR